MGKKVNTSLSNIHDHFTPWSQYLGYTKEKKLKLLRANKETFFLFEKDDVLLFWNEILNITNDNFQKNKSLLQKIENKGIPYLNNNEKEKGLEKESWSYGDLYIQYNIVFPEIDNLYDCVNEIYEEEETEEAKKNKNDTQSKKYIMSKNCSMNKLFDNNADDLCRL